MSKIIKGIRLKGKDEDWRVINVNYNRVTVVDLTKESLEITQMFYSDIVTRIGNKELQIIEESIVDLDKINLSPYALENFKKRKKIVNMVDQIFGPDYLEIKTCDASLVCHKIMAENNIKKNTFWRLINRYLKSGKKDYSLCDQRVLKKNKKKSSGGGRKLSDGEANFHRSAKDDALMEKWMKKYLTSSSTEITLEYCYIKLQDEYRDSHGNLGKPGTYPSMRQFAYFIKTNATPEQLQIKKTSVVEARNNNRLLKGDANNGVYGPMDMVEIDAHEVDVSLVSGNDHTLVVGRPVIYYMIDRETRIIVGFTASFDNNAVVAMNRVFECLIDPKIELLARHPDAPKYAMPYGVLPARVMTDNGSDFVSKEARRCARALGIDFCFSPAGVASLKPIVERSFGAFEKMIDPMMRNAGLIKKRHDSNHHKKAVLTIDQFRKMAEDFVYFHNTTLCEGIPMTKDMVDYKVKQIPCDAWRHCIENKGQNPKPIEDYDAFRLVLYKHKKASITRYGILVDKMKYIDARNKNLEAKCFLDSREKIEVALNPATVNYIYYFLDGVWSRAWLNPNLKSQSTYMDMTVAEAAAYRKKIAAERRKSMQEKRNQKSEFYREHEKTVSEAKKAHGNDKNITDDIKSARETEKMIEQKKLGQKNIEADNRAEDNKRIDNNDKELNTENKDDNLSFDDEYMKFMENL